MAGLLRPARTGLIALSLALAPALAGDPSGAATDRLERLRELARTRLAEAGALDGAAAADAYDEVSRLLDDEILDSLRTGGVFADPLVLDERLQAVTDAWGGATVRVRRSGTATLATVRLTETGHGNSVRVYGGAGDRAALVAALRRSGAPTVHAMPATRAGRAQFLAAWEGERSARGTTPLTLDLVRLEGERARAVWSTTELYRGALHTWGHSVHGLDVTLRYELQYPGWVPGCEGQTEAEDLLRYSARRETFELVRRHVVRGWHRGFHRAVVQLLEAARAHDATVLRRLVPDRALRASLPAGLAREPACDGVTGAPPQEVNVAGRAGDGRPWALWFRRAGSAWRLRALHPVLE